MSHKKHVFEECHSDIETFYEAAPHFMTGNKEKGNSAESFFLSKNRRQIEVIIWLNFFCCYLQCLSCGRRADRYRYMLCWVKMTGGHFTWEQKEPHFSLAERIACVWTWSPARWDVQFISFWPCIFPSPFFLACLPGSWGLPTLWLIAWSSLSTVSQTYTSYRCFWWSAL